MSRRSSWNCMYLELRNAIIRAVSTSLICRANCVKELTLLKLLPCRVIHSWNSMPVSRPQRSRGWPLLLMGFLAGCTPIRDGGNAWTAPLIERGRPSASHFPASITTSRLSQLSQLSLLFFERPDARSSRDPSLHVALARPKTTAGSQQCSTLRDNRLPSATCRPEYSRS